jgi:hypothetical protein
MRTQESELRSQELQELQNGSAGFTLQLVGNSKNSSTPVLLQLLNSEFLHSASNDNYLGNH